MNILCWGVAGLVSAEPVDRWTVVRLFIALQHFLVGGLLLTRSPVGVSGNVRQLCATIPSLVLCGLAFRNSPAPHAWPWYSQLGFASATIWGLWSLLTLGKNFAIFPALRSITKQGPYRIVRHPIYLAELLMVVATVWAGPNLWTVGALVLLIPAIIWRILAEENLLDQDPSYGDYRTVVRWRLLPRIW